MGPLGSLNISYSYPTFRNLPEDQRTWSFYEPQPCPQGDACINVFYQDGKGFKCVPSDQTFAAVIIGGLDWNKEADVLKADLTRCDGAIPSYHKMIYHHRAAMMDKWLLVCGGFYYGTDTYMVTLGSRAYAMGGLRNYYGITNVALNIM